MGFLANLSANRKIIKRLELLEEDAESFRKASRDLRSLELEFSNLWGKVSTALGRIEKRAATAERDRAKVEERQDPDEAEAGPSLGTASDGLTPAQLKWQERIRAERRAHGA